MLSVQANIQWNRPTLTINFDRLCHLFKRWTSPIDIQRHTENLAIIIVVQTKYLWKVVNPLFCAPCCSQEKLPLPSSAFPSAKSCNQQHYLSKNTFSRAWLCQSSMIYIHICSSEQSSYYARDHLMHKEPALFQLQCAITWACSNKAFHLQKLLSSVMYISVPVL